MLKRELEDSEFILHSQRDLYNDGSVKFLTWVTCIADNFRMMYRHHDTEADKDAYVESLRLKFLL